MKTQLLKPIAVLSLIIISAISYAGDMEPSSAPSSTMKTLSQIEPAVPFSKGDMPLTIKEPGVYYLTEGFVYTGSGTGAGNAVISVESSDVTIDLKGYTIDGNSSSKAASGIYSDNFDNITVKNGGVKGFSNFCVRLEGESSSNNRVENITANIADIPILVGKRSRVTNCDVHNGKTICIKVNINSVISDCIVSNDYEYSTNGIYAGTYSTVENCNVRMQSNYGIYVDTGSKVINCTTDYCNTYGIYASAHSTVSGCNAHNVGGTCIYTNGETLIVNNTLTGGSTGLQLGYGSTARGNQINSCTKGVESYFRGYIENNLIDDCSFGIVAQGLNSIKNNHLTSYLSGGIQITQRHNVIEMNTLISTDSIVTGLEITGDENLYLNNRLSNATNISNTGTSNKDGGGNITF